MRHFKPQNSIHKLRNRCQKICKKKSCFEALILLSIRVQRVNGSPVKPLEQLQIGLWLTTLQMAFSAHVPGVQGFTHF